MANKYAVETAFKLIDQTTGTLNKIGVKGNAVGKQLKKDFMKAQDQLTSLGKAAVKAGAAIAVAGAAAVGAWAAKGIKDAIEYDTALRKVSTVADTTTVSMEQLSRGLMNVSNDTGTAVAELAELQYSAIVSGIKTADSVSFVETAVKAATAAFTDSATVIDGLTAVLNAYGMEASQASTIAGQMLITNNLGKTSFEELNGALGKVLPTAARLNIGTDELFASLTALTANSIETPKAVKGLEKILETVQKPTDAAAKAARRLGIDFSVSALRSKGLAGFLEDIKQKTGGSEEAIMALFGSVESLNAITVLTGKGAGQFTEALSAMQNATETLDSAFQTIDASPAKRWGDIMNIIKNAGISLGTKLLPIIEKVTEKIEKVVDKLKDYDFTPVAEKIGSVFGSILKFGEHLLNLAGIIWKLRGPIMAVVGAVALYRGGMLLAAAAVNGFTAAQNIAKGVQLAAYLITGNQTKAMALYKNGTMGATVQTTLFLARQKAAQVLDFAGTIIKQGAAFLALKAQIIAAKIAMVAHVAVTKAVKLATTVWTGVQWALNAALTANPIGLIIVSIAALIAVIVIAIKYWDEITEWIDKNSEKVLAYINIITGPFGIIFSVIKELKDNWGAIVEAFKTEGMIAGLKRLGGVLFSAILAPIQGLLEILSHIPLIGEKIAPAAEKIKDFRNQLKGIEAETTIVQNVVPAQVQTAPATAAIQTATATAGTPAVVSAYGGRTNVTRTISASTNAPIAPMTRAEQYTYSQTTNRDEVEIGVRAESGTSVRAIRRPRSPNVSLDVSGGNNGR
jgi:TP901 family phage tail tape measure protein